jgi:hypothetical protein
MAKTTEGTTMMRDGEVSRAIGDNTPIYTVEYTGVRWEQFGCVYYREYTDARKAADKAIANHDAMAVYVVRVIGWKSERV